VTILNYVQLHCDGTNRRGYSPHGLCDEFAFTGAVFSGTALEARGVAGLRGWTVSPQFGDLCPACSENLQMGNVP
jgi:hypothetical protein